MTKSNEWISIVYSLFIDFAAVVADVVVVFVFVYVFVYFFYGCNTRIPTKVMREKKNSNTVEASNAVNEKKRRSEK